MTTEGKTNVDPEHPDREIEEDVMNVGFVAWLGAITTILIAVTVIGLIGVYYLTLDMQTAERQAEADERITDTEAHQLIDDMVVEGVFELPDVTDEAGEVMTRGGFSLPVERGMRQIVEANKK